MINEPGILDVAVAKDTVNPSSKSDTNTLNVPSNNHLKINSPTILINTADRIANNAAFDLVDSFLSNTIASTVPIANTIEKIGIYNEIFTVLPLPKKLAKLD